MIEAVGERFEPAVFHPEPLQATIDRDVLSAPAKVAFDPELDAAVPIFHYRDSLGLEADAIVELRCGEWAAFEVKLGASPAVVDGAAANLLRLRDRVAGPPPVALCVITGSGFGFTRQDGVRVVPIGALTA